MSSLVRPLPLFVLTLYLSPVVDVRYINLVRPLVPYYLQIPSPDRLEVLSCAAQSWMFEPDYLKKHPELLVVPTATMLTKEQVKQTQWYLDTARSLTKRKQRA